MKASITFRPVTRADLPLLGDWLRDPRVTPWWCDADKQLAGVEEDLDQPVMRQCIALIDGEPAAYAQVYPAHHWGAPHFADLPEDALAVDVFSGPVGFGHGGAWLGALAEQLLAEASVLVIDPDPENVRAVRAYEKAGFEGVELRPSEDGTPARIMTRYR